MKWEIIETKNDDIVKTLLKNRGIKTQKQVNDFLKPKNPSKIDLEEIGLIKSLVKKVINRVKKAKKGGEHVIIYGDYDADGICATGILWEALHSIGVDALPYIPDRFSDGYGIKPETVEKIISKYTKTTLIITVDNGIVAYGGIEAAKDLGIDVIVIDHHAKGDKKPPTSYVLHTTKVCGSALAWFVARELGVQNGLELAAIGTIADQMILTGVNRSIVKFGLPELEKTRRPGLKNLFANSGIKEVGTYEVNYIIAPRINAMGRLAHGIDSLRLLCTKSELKAVELARLLDKTNLERQQVVDKVTTKVLSDSKNIDNSVLVVNHESFHEGVIGLAAGKLVETFYRPAIVLSSQGKISKASARSIAGFNIIEAIKSTGLIIEGGGHPMAAGFNIETDNISAFRQKINDYAKKILTADLLERKLKIDCQVNFIDLSWKLYKLIQEFEPTGLGNPAPTFMSRKVSIIDARLVGRESKHLKLKLKQDEHIFDAIFFGGGEIYSKLNVVSSVDIAYRLEENTWGANHNLQLVIRDLRS